jgi:lysophospholipid acyltransferase
MFLSFISFRLSLGQEIGWRGAENIDIIGCESATSVQAMIRNWNKRTQGWLERYTYMRSGKSLVATYLVSAEWHGLYPGYFFAFLSITLPTNIERLFKQKINPYVIPEYNGYDPSTYPHDTVRGRVYEIAGWIGTWTTLPYIMQVFYMVSAERSLRAWKGYYFSGHIAMIFVYLFMTMMPSKRTGAASPSKSAEGAIGGAGKKETGIKTEKTQSHGNSGDNATGSANSARKLD